MDRDLRAMIGHRVRELRRAKGLSKKMLAEEAGVSVSYLYFLENGIRGSRIEELMKIARALGVGIGELVDGGPN